GRWVSAGHGAVFTNRYRLCRRTLIVVRRNAGRIDTGGIREPIPTCGGLALRIGAIDQPIAIVVGAVETVVPRRRGALLAKACAGQAADFVDTAVAVIVETVTDLWCTRKDGPIVVVAV